MSHTRSGLNSVGQAVFPISAARWEKHKHSPFFKKKKKKLIQSRISNPPPPFPGVKSSAGLSCPDLVFILMVYKGFPNDLHHRGLNSPLAFRRGSYLILPPLLAFVLVFLRATAIRRSFRTTMLFGFFQKFVQTKRIFLKLNRSLSVSLSTV